MPVSKLNRDIIACEACPRLRRHCKKIAREKRKSYANWEYWGRPVPNFGDNKAGLLIIGLAPAAHGANRTGRMFTGDRSGDWLYRALHKSGFANQSQSTGVDDGLKLKDCLITAACHCAPPDNKPTKQELKTCRPFFQRTLDTTPAKVYLCLGGIGWNVFWQYAMDSGLWQKSRPKFKHSACVKLAKDEWVLASYHPSQQNTFTKRLTEPMFDEVFKKANQLLSK